MPKRNSPLPDIAELEPCSVCSPDMECDDCETGACCDTNTCLQVCVCLNPLPKPQA